MPLLSKPSSAPKISLYYITIGAITLVWTGIWLWYLNRNPPLTDGPWYWAIGFLCTGAVVLGIGLALGRISRAARDAELPPKEVIGEQANIDQTAAAHSQVVIPPTGGIAPLARPVAVQGQVPVAVQAPLPATPVSHPTYQS